MTKIEALELELAARKMVEGTGLEWWSVIRWKCHEKYYIYGSCDKWRLEHPREQYELALDVLEGKPVWEGDELYFPSGEKIIANNAVKLSKKNGGIFDLSWNPPQPKTVMVELLVEDAKLCASLCLSPNIAEACRKALEGVK